MPGFKPSKAMVVRFWKANVTVTDPACGIRSSLEFFRLIVAISRNLRNPLNAYVDMIIL